MAIQGNKSPSAMNDEILPYSTEWDLFASAPPNEYYVWFVQASEPDSMANKN
jgi:hypothetical protein